MARIPKIIPSMVEINADVTHAREAGRPSAKIPINCTTKITRSIIGKNNPFVASLLMNLNISRRSPV